MKAFERNFVKTMPRPKLCGPCAVANCTKYTPFFRSFTENAYKSAQREETLHNFTYLTVGDQLCCSHYNDIVASNRHKKRKCSKEPSCKQVERNGGGCPTVLNVNHEGNKGTEKPWGIVLVEYLCCASIFFERKLGSCV